ncbi:DUF1501 domain-containing protein [Leptospira sp. GIMC2001]|uniref:DUF1501 domain-containing protein n=1 Tax=Leptospira sp. GIMC2001 TaxID=1513297 RepID=UPI00234A9F17|nr:DUF1501 domain-containing protein [Leptospira sp. GIMC2001]WCL49769.1 DUF1501 domain-containing protein [Leptospira sp. GIMC2001]
MSINYKFNRLEFLQASASLFAGLTLTPNLLNAVSYRNADSKNSKSSDLSLPSPIKSIIFVNMDGGMSHVDTLDPKANSKFSKVSSSIRGLSVLEPFQKTAKFFNKLSVLRTTYSEDGDHGMAQHLLNTGYRSTETIGIPDLPHMGAMVSYVKSLNLKDGPYFPRYVTMGTRNGKIGDPGYLSVAHAGFHIGDPNKPLSNLTPSWGKYTKERLDRRENFLETMNEEFQNQNHSLNLDRWDSMYVAAKEFRDSAKSIAFDWMQEPEKVQTRYGQTVQARSFMIAKRLAEIEVPFIQISIGGWDTHDNNKARITKIMSDTDQGLAALLQDLDGLGLLQQTMFVLSSEFGRTPDVGTRDGRDHHPKVWTTLVGGGKISKGKVIGETDEKGEKPAKGSTAIHVRDLISTIYNYAGIDPKKQIINSQNRPISIGNKASRVVTI